MRVFPFPEGVTPLPFDATAGLCTECEGRPAFVEIRRPDDVTAPARRLCSVCFLREAPPEPSQAEIMEQEVLRLAEAERTASAEDLGRRAEFLEEWSVDKGEPLNAVVAAFIERHRHSAPPLAAPAPDVRPEQADLQAARLALLVMRAALRDGEGVESERVVLRPDTGPLSRDEAVDRLARMPKPLECYARLVGTLMTVRCRTIDERLRSDDRRSRRVEGGAVYFPHLRLEHGDRYPGLTVYCLGRRESLTLTVAEVERWHRDYEVRPIGTNASPPGFYLATNPDAARAAHAAGAAYLMKCYFGPDDWAAEKEGRVIDLRSAGNWRDFPEVYSHEPELGVTCSECRKRPATWVATNRQVTPWRDRRLCGICAARELEPAALDSARHFAEWVGALTPKGRRSVADDVAQSLERMERWWKHLPIPPAVEAALDRCREM
ncbi:MAG TPA: hypothetical protein VEI06_16195 [Gemmatimonadaceae bacterium]|nr:hypothetical protein [Gemmatimonadaceae bacterium]